MKNYRPISTHRVTVATTVVKENVDPQVIRYANVGIRCKR